MAPGTVNLRDISTADEASVVKGMVMRSSAPIYFTDAGMRHLETELDVKRAIDLRGKDEIHEKPKATALLTRECLLIPSFSSAPVENTRWHHVDLVGKAIKRCIRQRVGCLTRLRWTILYLAGYKETMLREAIAILGFSEGGLVNLYSLIVQDTKEEMKELMEMIADHIDSGNVPVLVHCTAGKDRTGIVVALLLLLAGVSDEKVVADYAKSGGELEKHSHPHLNDGMMSKIMPRDYLCNSPAPAMESVIAEVALLGGAENYLLHYCGVREEAVAAIKKGLRKNA
ncbi:Tyrosine-protein phosphatase [Diplonema papillatum]|nr:Tyrosine-protein phosphatase [Diplonema papillatum]